MFTAHISGWSKKELLDTPVMELKRWYDEALKLHNHLNTTEDTNDVG